LQNSCSENNNAVTLKLGNLNEGVVSRKEPFSLTLKWQMAAFGGFQEGRMRKKFRERLQRCIR
jgi:hypothetical protein